MLLDCSIKMPHAHSMDLCSMLHISPCHSHILPLSYCSTVTTIVMYLNEASWNSNFKLRIQLVWSRCRVCEVCPTWSLTILDHAAGSVEKSFPNPIDSSVRLLILDQDSGSTEFILPDGKPVSMLKSCVHPPSVRCAEQSTGSRMFTSLQV